MVDETLKTITIEPVTRIEGHAKITIELDNEGKVHDAHFHVTEFRGFEKLCEGRPFYEMPSLMGRVCGICCVSHMLASAKACDALMAVRIPDTAINLRRIANLAQLIQSHALSFFYLSSPDLLLGMDAEPSQRNIMWLLKTHPELARDGVYLRKFGQEIIEFLGGKRLNASWIVAGGVNAPLKEEIRKKIFARTREAMPIAQRTLDWYKTVVYKYAEEMRIFANFPTLFMGLVTSNGQLEHYDGKLRVVDQTGYIVQDEVDPLSYGDLIGEAAVPYSYLKAPYYKPLGYPQGIYRVGPLARLNVIDRVGTPKAHDEWIEYRSLNKEQAMLSNFHNHYARLIEIVYSIERIQQLLEDPNITRSNVRSNAGPNNMVGIGVTEAPRGTLIHHYRTDESGIVNWANLIVATGHNSLAMNRGVLQVAKHYLNGSSLSEGMLNRVEAVIRTFDPCLSCSTHAFGKMPIHVKLIDSQGHVLQELKRD